MQSAVPAKQESSICWLEHCPSELIAFAGEEVAPGTMIGTGGTAIVIGIETGQAGITPHETGYTRMMCRNHDPLNQFTPCCPSHSSVAPTVLWLGALALLIFLD